VTGTDAKVEALKFEGEGCDQERRKRIGEEV
jgi:hypothetical protein